MKVRNGSAGEMRTAIGVVLVVCILVGGCKVEWGGSRLALENPAAAADSAAAPKPAVLPAGPILFLVRLEGDGRAMAAPIARLGERMESLPLPDSLDGRYRAAFDSAFLRSGMEFRLRAGGRRIGTLVLEGPPKVVDAHCLSVAAAAALLLPGQPVPRTAFTLSTDLPRPPAAPAVRRPDRRMAVAGPVLAEQLIGGTRAYLARRASLKAVGWDEDSLPRMAATYLVADSLRPGPPVGDAVSLFFLARYERGRGYVPTWTELRRYSSGEDKEAFEYLDWLRTPRERVDFLRRFDGEGVSLAASLLPRDAPERGRHIDWVEGKRCRALRLLEEAAARRPER
ncbi:MAG: hypothetical protein ACE5HQ_02105 [Gemmatimonadota bacterium]